MRMYTLLSVGFLFLVGCRQDIYEFPDGACANGDMKTSTPIDMTMPPKCAAAKGLSGDVLGDLCLDMDKIDTQGLTNRGFNLTVGTLGCAGWEVTAGNLQPKSLNTTSGPVQCGFLLPSLPFDGVKYPRLTLSVIQQASLPNTMHQARVEMFDISSPLRIWINPAPATTIAHRTMVEIDTAMLPAGANARAKFELVAPMGPQTPTWTISSIAVLGQPAQ